jgi:hypothetical protein
LVVGSQRLIDNNCAALPQILSHFRIYLSLNPKPVVSVLQQMRRHEEAIQAFDTSAELDKSSGSALVHDPSSRAVFL